MGNLGMSVAHFFSQVLFSAITPPLLIPGIARLSVTRSLVAFCFGRLYGARYEDVIDSFQGRYGLAMEAGLVEARDMVGSDASLVLDCGTGTGFVTRQAAAHFPEADFVGSDILRGMLAQARSNCLKLGSNVFHVQADTFELPLADQSVDVLLAQNTIPCFEEFSRVCRPGGAIVYVDTSAGWIASLAARLVLNHGLFDRVTVKRVGLGFFILAQTR